MHPVGGFDMASIFNVQRKTIPSRGDADLIGPLAFSLVGLLTHCVALLMQNEPSLASLRFTLIVSAAPVAALAALRFIGNADEFMR
jgi:hypothetical protein